MQALRVALDAAGYEDVPVVVRTQHRPATVREPTVAPAAATAASLTVGSAEQENGAQVAAAARPANSASEGVASEEPAGAQAPGMLLTHYAPYVETFLVGSVRGSASAGRVKIEPLDIPAGAAAPPANIDVSKAVVVDLGARLAALRGITLWYTDLSPSGSIVEARQRVFEVLRHTETVPGAAYVLLADPLLLHEGTSHDRRAGAADPASASAAAAVPGSEGAAAAPRRENLVDRDAHAAAGAPEHADALRDRMYRAASGRTLCLVLE